MGEIGLSSIFAQAGAQGSKGIAFLLDTSQWSISRPLNVGVSVVTFNTVGATAGALGSNGPISSNPNDPIGTLSHGGAIVGAFAGAGFSGGITNANSASDLKGLSGTASADVGLGLGAGVQFSKSSSGIFTFSVSPPFAGVGEGLSASSYPTNTTITSDNVITRPKNRFPATK